MPEPDDRPRKGEGYDRLERRTEDFLDRQSGNLADRPGRTIFGWAVKGGLIVLGLVIVFGLIGFVAGWFNAGKDIVSPDNVRRQYTAIIGDWNGMEAAACNAKEAELAQKEEGDPVIVESPGLAYRAKYREIQVDYNRRQQNLFEGEKVGPKGYPREAPSIKAMQDRAC